MIAESLRTQRGSMLKGLQFPYQVHAGNGSADGLQLARVIKLGRSATAAVKNSESKQCGSVQRVAVSAGSQRCDHRQIGFEQLMGKCVFFHDRIVTPTLRPVELGYQRAAIGETDLVNAILIAVERRNATVG